MGTPSGGIYDFLTTCMLPHGVAVVATILVVGTCFVALAVLISSEVGVLLEDEDFVASIDEAVDDAYDALNRFVSLRLDSLGLTVTLSLNLADSLCVSVCVGQA